MCDRDAMKDIREEARKWEEETLKKTVARFPERQPAFATSSGEVVKALYTPLDIANVEYSRDLGFPGVYPFTRGIQPNMYRGRTWSFRQYAGFGTAEESNRRYKYLLEQGQTGLSVAFDLPTQIGYDSDHPRAEGEVGKVGVAIDSLADMEVLFNGIPLDKVSTSMTINAPAGILLAMYVAVAEKQGVPASKLEGTVQNDVLKEYLARGTYIFPPLPSLRMVADTMAYCGRNAPRWNSISISGYHIREAGSTAVQEVAFTLANAIAYVEAVVRTGLNVDDFAPRISWIFNTHMNFFEEVAKFRALRRMWARIMKERFGAEDPRSWMFRTHTQTGGSTLTAQQPDNNIVRTTIQAMAAVLGGIQSMALSCRDEALGLPTEQSSRLALRTQQVIAFESGIADTVDPLGGSYYVEALTDRIEKEADGYIAKIEAMGGPVKAIESGYLQQEIQNAAYRHQQEVEEGKKIVVGVNSFAIEEKAGIEFQRVDPKVGEVQRARVAELRRKRDNAAVTARLERVRAAAKDEGASLMPAFLEAVKSYATLGEICQVLREVFGEYQETTRI
ncbi:MAG: methylmalonyl-CoA mutase family protein [Chloroflexi bacterium]|nr:methylmalonyl-CoA mutase family protein [Chloroflexota bacterium]